MKKNNIKEIVHVKSCSKILNLKLTNIYFNCAYYSSNSTPNYETILVTPSLSAFENNIQQGKTVTWISFVCFFLK